MSRAFVSEETTEANASQLPERPISSAPNLVTARGLKLINEEVERLQTLLARASADDPDRPRLARDLRYWKARQASAQLVPSPPGDPDEVAFGTLVTIVRDGHTTAYQIVGEDEADPARGLLSWISPVATALLGGQAGDEVDIGGGRAPVTIQRIERGQGMRA
jgi:transcription elongation GreA/GreB family factor